MDKLEIEKYLIEQKNMDYIEATTKADKLDGISADEIDRILDGDVRQTCKTDVRQSCKTNDVRQENAIIPDVLHQFYPVRQSCKTTITIRLDEALKNEILSQADELGTSTSSLIRSVLQNYFKLN